MITSAASIPIAMFQRPATLVTPGGARVNGRWVAANPTSTPIKAVIQQAAEKDLRMMPDDEKLDGLVTIWTFAELKTIDEDAGTDAQSIITPEGKQYRIVKAARRSEADFTRAIGRLHNDRGRSV